MAGALLSWQQQRRQPATAAEKLSIFKAWWEEAEEHVDQAKDQTVFYGKWLKACTNRKFASDPLQAAWLKALDEPPPPAATRDYAMPMPEKMKQLVAFLAQLQDMAGEQPFFLTCRDAGRMLGVPFTTAFAWLELLGDKSGPYQLLTKISTGSRAARKANEYRFHPPEN